MQCAISIAWGVGTSDSLIEFIEHQDRADQKEQEDWVIVQSKVKITYVYGL